MLRLCGPSTRCGIWTRIPPQLVLFAVLACVAEAQTLVQLAGTGVIFLDAEAEALLVTCEMIAVITPIIMTTKGA